MDFVMVLPLSASKKNAIWLIVDRLTKSAANQRYLRSWKTSPVVCWRDSLATQNPLRCSIW